MIKYLPVLILIFLFSCAKESIVPQKSTISINGNTKICTEDNITIDAYHKNAIAYYWEVLPDDTNCYKLSSQSEYTFHGFGFDTFYVRIYLDSVNYVRYQIVSIICDPYVYIPASFTPDGLGVSVNDTFRVVMNKYYNQPIFFEIKIFSSENLLMYESQDYSTHGWDGNYLNSEKKAPAGYYNCIVKAYSYREEEYVYFTQSINLIR